jgi:hypothetical protein
VEHEKNTWKEDAKVTAGPGEQKRVFLKKIVVDLDGYGDV